MEEGRREGGGGLAAREADESSVRWSLMSLVLEFCEDGRNGIVVFVYIRHSSIGLPPRGEVAGLLRGR